MVKPLKLLLPEFKNIEERITAVIFKKFEIDIKYLDRIKKYDIQAQEIEYDTFFKKIKTLQYLSPEEANRVFMCRFWDYFSLKDVKFQNKLFGI